MPCAALTAQGIFFEKNSLQALAKTKKFKQHKVGEAPDKLNFCGQSKMRKVAKYLWVKCAAPAFYLKGEVHSKSGIFHLNLRRANAAQK